jgi:flagellar biosynthesis protein FlhA
VTVSTATSSPSMGLSRLLRQPDVLLAVAVLVIVAVMIIPFPAPILDLFITLNLSISIVIMLIALYVKEPLEFSVFPSLLLIVTLFRLALNISSSRLVLLNGYAGQVIDAFGSFVIGGNYVIGIVVFLLLMIIQFAVITNGAGRVAEVTARFTLDAMPGKQMAIDADLNAGLINEDEARQRRRMVERESDFYGSMDGASKFVKGDAIAGVAVIIVNIVGGFAVGVLQNGMELIEALQTYTLLTVGDGLVAQIPALLISTATGIIITRARSDFGMGSDMFQQLLGNPRVLGILAGVLFTFGLVPGLPKLPFLGLGALSGGAAYMIHRRRKEAVAAPPAPAPPKPIDSSEEAFELLKVDPVAVELGYGLIPLVDESAGGGLLDRTSAIRRQIALEMGFVVPKIRIRDNLRLPPNGYAIKLRGETVAEGELIPNRLLAMPSALSLGSLSDIEGAETQEPVYGLPAIWIDKKQKERAEITGFTVVDPSSVLTTHLAETIRLHSAELLSRQDVQKLLQNLSPESEVLVGEASSESVGLSLIQRVLQNLLAERVSIRDLPTILEIITTRARDNRDPFALTEHTRQALGRSICNQYRDENDGTLYVTTLGPLAEQRMAESLHQTDQGLMTHLSPDVGQHLLERLGEESEKMAQAGHQPVVICSARLRSALRRFTQRSLPQLTVLSYSEIPAGIDVYASGMVEVPGGD